jgi:hypothetical protein
VVMILLLIFGTVLVLLGAWFGFGIGRAPTSGANTIRWALRILAIPLLIGGLGLIAAAVLLEHLPKPKPERHHRIEIPNIFIR